MDVDESTLEKMPGEKYIERLNDEKAFDAYSQDSNLVDESGRSEQLNEDFFTIPTNRHSGLAGTGPRGVNSEGYRPPSSPYGF